MAGCCAPEFTEGRLRTDMVERDWAPEPLRAAAAERAADAVARHVWAGNGREASGVDAPLRPGRRAAWLAPEPWS